MTIKELKEHCLKMIENPKFKDEHELILKLIQIYEFYNPDPVWNWEDEEEDKVWEDLKNQADLFYEKQKSSILNKIKECNNNVSQTK